VGGGRPDGNRSGAKPCEFAWARGNVIGRSGQRGSQLGINRAFWGQGGHVAGYRNRVLKPAEVLVLVRYRDLFARRALEVGCGAGRILGYLVALGAEAHGIDLSSDMVDYCRHAYPGAEVRVGDLGALGASTSGAYDVVLAPDNVLDVFGDAERRRVLGDMRDLLAPSGLLVFSSHNLAHLDPAAHAPVGAGGGLGPGALARKLVDRSPAQMLKGAGRLARRASNRRRLSALEYRGADHAVINDVAHDYGLLHYYIRRDDQGRQLAELGLELVESLELEGGSVAPGSDGAGSSLYYVARVPS
jgi:SAM-dependent methyltransferase